VHTQQITGLAVHPVTHGVYTTSTDGNLKITDIETLSVLFTVSIGTPIVIFYLRPWIRDYAFTRANAEYNSLMVLSDNSIRVWGPLHCCTTITEFTSDVVGLHCFTPVTYSPRSRERTSSVSYLEAMIGNKQFNALTLDVEEDVKEESSDNESDYDDEILDFKKSNSASPVRAGSIAKIQNPGVAAAEIDSNDRRNETKNQDEEAVFKMNKKNHRRKGKNELKFTRNMTLNGYFVTRTEHYMKVWSSSGKLETSLAEDVVFDGVRSWGISLKQQLIACLMDDRSVRFFGLTKSTRNAPGMIKFSAPAGLYADAPRISAGSEMGKKTADLLHVIPASFFGSSDLPTCISFVDCVPRISGNKKSQKNVSPGGPRATFVSNSTKRSSDPIDFEHHPFEFTRESMVVGGSVGSLRWFDIFNEFRMIHTMEEISGVVESIVCSSSRMLLFVHARNLNDRNKSQIACFKLPGLELTYYIPSISNLSSWIPSKYLPYVGVGTLTGHLRVYFLQPTGDEPFRSIFGKAAEEDEAYKNVLNAARDAAARDAEVMDGDKALSRASGYSYEVTMCDGLVVDTRDQNTANELSGHVDAVTSIEFCDELKCIATCSLDCSVKLWTLDKILLRTIRFDLPVHCISFPVFYQPGDLLLATSKALQVLSEHATGIKNLVNHACNLRSRWLSQTRPSAVADSDLRRVRISSEVGLLGDDIPTSFEQQNSGVSSTPSKQTDANFSVVSLHAHSSSSSDRQKHIVSSPTLSHHPFSRSAVDSTQPQTTSRLNLEDGCGDLKGSIGTFNVRRPANCNAPLRKAKRLAMELPPPKKRPSVFKAYPTAFRGAHRGLSLGSEATDSCSFLPSDVAHQVPDDVASAVSASGPHSLARPSVVPAPPTVAPPSSSAKASMLVRHRVTSGMK
jgi:WD40 repeat protein